MATLVLTCLLTQVGCVTSLPYSLALQGDYLFYKEECMHSAQILHPALQESYPIPDLLHRTV